VVGFCGEGVVVLERMDEHFIVSVDVGSSKIVVLFASEREGRMKIFGQAQGKSAGVRKGVIVDVDVAAAAIKAVGERASSSCGTKFDGAVVNISDVGIKVFNTSPHKYVEREKVREGDVRSLIKTAESRKAGQAERLISSVTHHYVLDRDEHHAGAVVQYPIGEKAEMLEVSMHIVVASEQKAKNIERSFEQCHKRVLNLVPSSMASSEPCLTQDQKDVGVCLVDMGSGVMDLSVFREGRICYSAVIPEGADRVTNEIADAFKASFEEAERLKLHYGRAMVKTLVEDRLIRFQQEGEVGYRYLSHQSLVEVIEAAYLSLFVLIRDKIDKKLFRSLNSGFVLVGGGVRIKGCADLMVQCFKKRAKIGHIDTNLINLDTDAVFSNDNLLSPEYACALGLLLFDDGEQGLEERLSVRKVGLIDKIKDIGRKF